MEIQKQIDQKKEEVLKRCGNPPPPYWTFVDLPFAVNAETRRHLARKIAYDLCKDGHKMWGSRPSS